MATTQALGLTRLLGLPVALGAAVVCFLIRMIAVRFHLDAPRPQTGESSA